MLSGRFYYSNKTKYFYYYLDANECVSTQDIESIAYQACDKIYKKDDNGPYDSLW
jgi:hypothetical protein